MTTFLSLGLTVENNIIVSLVEVSPSTLIELKLVSRCECNKFFKTFFENKRGRIVYRKNCNHAEQDRLAAEQAEREKAERDRFFASLKQVENRATEPWTVDAVAYLHHPLRAKEAIGYLQPSLALMQEIQATGDIFFPRQFITATLNGHSSMEAAGIVRQFLETRPNYPPRLKRKILMAADMVFRAASR